jgi:hypothetical protein
MVQPVTVGLDIAKNVFTPTASMLAARRRTAASFAVGRLRPSSLSSSLAWSASRRAQQRITGLARSRSWATKSVSCRRHT